MNVLIRIVLLLVAGVSAWLDPAGFAAWARPNRVRFRRDAGVFQIGIGLVAGLCVPSARRAGQGAGA
ncbi:hypothetical protein WBK31_23510 [Nonomuraea sp. N2-4H]|uniref:hypothetical protein n=1 Tax=Nonomuraea sp. N2-4H TaxID=3128898 RepID=UPI0032535A55